MGAEEYVQGYDNEMLKQEIELVLDELTEREATVMRLRFGLMGQMEMTLEDIGTKLHVGMGGGGGGGGLFFGGRSPPLGGEASGNFDLVMSLCLYSP